MLKTWITAVRHGETKWNVAMRLQGIQNSELSEKGNQQVESVSKELSNKKFDMIISSDLGRAIKTAEVINKYHKLDIIRDPSLRERNFGIMEGLTREEILEKYPDVFSAYQKRKESYKIPQGDSLIEFYERVLTGLEKVISLNKGKRILIVTHGGVLDCIIRMMFNYSLSARRNFSIYNTAINIFSVMNNEWTLEEWGNSNHLNTDEASSEFN